MINFSRFIFFECSSTHPGPVPEAISVKKLLKNIHQYGIWINKSTVNLLTRDVRNGGNFLIIAIDNALFETRALIVNCIIFAVQYASKPKNYTLTHIIYLFTETNVAYRY